MTRYTSLESTVQFGFTHMYKWLQCVLPHGFVAFEQARHVEVLSITKCKFKGKSNSGVTTLPVLNQLRLCCTPVASLVLTGHAFARLSRAAPSRATFSHLSTVEHLRKQSREPYLGGVLCLHDIYVSCLHEHPFKRPPRGG